MTNFAEIFPASARMQELCTNGLFLNLLDFPEALRLPYRQLQTQVLNGALPGASLLLYECSVNAIRFPALIAAGIAFRQSDISSSDKARILLSLADPQRLLTVLHSVFLSHPRKETEPYLAAADKAEALFAADSYRSWILRDSACAVQEMDQTPAGSGLITCLNAFNEMIAPLAGFYRHLQEQPQGTPSPDGKTPEGGLQYTYNLETVDPSPFILYKNREYLLAQSWDADSRRLFYRAPASGICMIGEPLAIVCSADTAERARQAALDAGVASALREAYRMPDVQRPHFLDHWLSQALARRDRGYLLLTMEEGMGKTLYTSLLDPASPYYLQTTLFSNCSVLRYAVSVLPETTDPAHFLAFVQAGEKQITGSAAKEAGLPPAAQAADYARGIAASLNRAAAAEPGRQVLLIVDGMQWADPADSEADTVSFASVFPRAAQLDANVYILLTGLPESGTFLRELLHNCDPSADTAAFRRSHEDYRRTLRIYLSETLLRRTGDQTAVNRLDAALHSRFSEACLLRNVYPLCREASDNSPERFLKRFSGPQDLAEAYIGRLTELYGPKYGHTLEQVLNTLALCPGPVDLRSFGLLLPDHPEPAVLRTILRDLRPLLVLTDANHAMYRDADIQTAVLAHFSPQWRILCEDILRERRQLFSSSADPLARTELLENLGLFAAELTVPECTELLMAIGKLLAPDPKRTGTLPACVTRYYQAVSAKYDDESRNPLRMETIAALSLSRRTSERLSACRRMESLRETIHYDEKLYGLYCSRYADELSLTDPLSESTVHALAAFRRKTDTPADTAFLWHTETLSRGGLYDALKRYAGGTTTPEDDSEGDMLRSFDPLRLDYVRTLLPAILVSCRAALQQPVPQECAVTSHQLVGFCETVLLAMLPVFCIRGCMPEAGEFFGFMKDLLQQTYALRKDLAEAIAAYGTVPHADIDYREKLYTVSTAEIRRREALSRDLFEWVLTFPRSQRLRFYADHTPQWRLLESVLRLEDPAYASVRGPVPQNRANDICQSILQASHTGAELHADVVRLRFLLEHCSLSTRRSLEAAEALGSRMLETDPFNIYTNAGEVVADFSWLNQILQKGRSFFTNRQSDEILGVLRESFVRILENNQFYDYLITAQARLDALEYGPLVCEKNVEDAPAPVEKLTALQALVLASPDKTGPRAQYAEYLAGFLTEHGSTMSGSFLDACVSWCLDMNPPSAKLAGVVPAVLYARWKKLGAPDPAFCDLDGTPDTEGAVLRSRLYYRRAASCYLLEGGSLRVEALKHAVETQNPDPAVRAFLYLCLAITAGARSLTAAWKLLGFSEDALIQAASVPGSTAGPDSADQDISALRAAILRTRSAMILLADTGSLTGLPKLLEEIKASGASAGLSLHRYARIWTSPLSRQIPKNLVKDLAG